MRFLKVAALAAFLLAPGIARAAVTCADLPKAEAYVQDHLRPGPNTRLAQRHLEAARHARSDKDCQTELGRVNYYAKRSAAADARAHH
jgi:hypothetical protein